MNALENQAYDIVTIAAVANDLELLDLALSLGGAADGTRQGAYIESGRYPTPVRLTLAILLSAFGLWRPHYYGKIIKLTNVVRRVVPPFALFARSWPVPLLKLQKMPVRHST